MKEVDSQISAQIVNNPHAHDDTIPVCLIDTFEGFDATFHRTPQWILVHKLNDAPGYEVCEHNLYSVMRRSCHSCAGSSRRCYI